MAAFSAPRDLNELVTCRLSSLSRTVPPLASDNQADGHDRRAPQVRGDAAARGLHVGQRDRKASRDHKAYFRMLLSTHTAPPFYKNGYLLGCETTREAVVIDPGDEIEEVIAAASRLPSRVTHILLTHAHLDHITGVARAKQAFDAPVLLHEADLPLYEAVVQQGLMFGLRVDPQPPVDRFYRAQERC